MTSAWRSSDGRSPDGGVKFATIALTGATYSPSAAAMADDEREGRRVPELALAREEVGVEVREALAGGLVADLVEPDRFVPGVRLGDDAVLEPEAPRR